MSINQNKFVEMITQDQLERLYGDDAEKLFKYLNNKNRGGTNNAKGNTFENQFAVFKIAEHFNKRFGSNAAPDDIRFSSQELCFIDDLIVKDRAEITAEHYQLKDVQSLNWDSNPHPISNDFRMQHAICSEAGETPHLELVVSREELKQELEDAMANDLNDKVTVHHFPKGESMNQLLQNNDEVKAVLTEMCALNAPTSDKLDTLGTIVLGAWTASTQKATTLKEILDACYNLNPNYIKGFDRQLPQALREVLNRIPRFSYQVEGGYISWSFNATDNGVVSHQIGTKAFLDWENMVINLNPNNFEELESYLI